MVMLPVADNVLRTQGEWTMSLNMIESGKIYAQRSLMNSKVAKSPSRDRSRVDVSCLAVLFLQGFGQI